MQSKSNRWMLWIVAAVIGALVVTDMLTAFTLARETVAPAPQVAIEAGDGRVLVAQDQPPPKRRRNLMDLLFGDPEPSPQQRVPLVEKPVAQPTKKAALPPPKPKVDKAPGATRLAVFGDSLATDVGNALERFYAEDPNLEVLVQGVGSSSFVRPDFFDWPAKVNEQIAANTFDIAVFIIGVNDRQKMRLNDQIYGSLTPEWTTEYSARVTSVVRALRAAHKPVIWIGLPPMEPPKFAKAMIQVNEIQRLAAFSGGAEYLDIYEKFATDDGGYTARGPDLNGNQVRMRRDDGIHFSSAGADKLAFYVSQSLRNYYRGGGTVGIEVADPLLGTDAQLMLRPPYQGLGQMKLLEVAGAVIPLSNAKRRAADLVSADLASLSSSAPVGFDLSQMLQAPVGRADAFGVGVVENPTGR